MRVTRRMTTVEVAEKYYTDKSWRLVVARERTLIIERSAGCYYLYFPLPHPEAGRVGSINFQIATFFVSMCMCVPL